MLPRMEFSGGLLKQRQQLGEVGKFGIIGVTNTILDLLIFNALLFTAFESSPAVAKVVSTVVSATSSYFMNRHWTWRHRARSGTHRELPTFLLLSALALGITEACLLFSHYGLGLTSKLSDNIAANGFGLLLATLFRFWSFKRFVFLHPDRVEQKRSDTDRPVTVPIARMEMEVD